MALTKINNNTLSAVTTLPAAIAVGSMIKLQTQTASSSSTITFSSTYITSTYNRYIITMDSLNCSSDGGNITADISINNGSSYLSSVANYLWIRGYSNTGGNADVWKANMGDAASSIFILGSGIGAGTTAPETYSGTLTLLNTNSGKGKLIQVDGQFLGNGGQLVRQEVNMAHSSTSAINNIKFAPNTGTITNGTFCLYGVIK